MITIDLEAARVIHKDIIRSQRKLIFEKLDVDFIRAIERGDFDEQSKIANLKQKLRDLPECDILNNVNSVDDLRLLTIDKLLGD